MRRLNLSDVAGYVERALDPSFEGALGELPAVDSVRQLSGWPTRVLVSFEGGGCVTLTIEQTS